jgi:hypothetical protein
MAVASRGLQAPKSKCEEKHEVQLSTDGADSLFPIKIGTFFATLNQELYTLQVRVSVWPISVGFWSILSGNPDLEVKQTVKIMLILTWQKKFVKICNFGFL